MIDRIPTMTFIFKMKQLLDGAQKVLHRPHVQQRLVLVVVCTVLLLDNMLYMVIVPIIPAFLKTTYHTDSPVSDPSATTVPTTDCTGTHSNCTTEVFLPPAPPVSDGGAIGFLFASKAIVQLCVNPFSGSLIDRIGYTLPLAIGLAILFVSTTAFAFAQTYAALFLARSVQGVGSAFADTAGLSMIADRFTEKAERSKALGIALAFISFGSLFAPPFGGVLYEFAGKAVPFLILAVVCLVDGLLLMLTVTKPTRQEVEVEYSESEPRPKGTPIYRLLMDPYVAVCAGALAMSNVSLAFLEPTLSMWMKERMRADEWEMGLVWLPAFLPHVGGVYVTVRLARSFPQHQWLMAGLGLALEGLSCCAIPFARQFFVVVFPIMTICFGIALVDTSLLPMLAHLVDVRHASVYGSVYAIADIAYCLAYAVGPIVAGGVVHTIGFFWLNMFIFVSNILYAPVLVVLRNVYHYDRLRDEEIVLLSGGLRSPGTPRFKTYVQEMEARLVTCQTHDFGSHLKATNQQPVYWAGQDYHPLASNALERGFFAD